MDWESLICSLHLSIFLKDVLIYFIMFISTLNKILIFFFYFNQQQLIQQHIKSKRPLVKNVAIQKETSAAGPDNRSKIVLLVDASQQTGQARFFLCIYIIDFKIFFILLKYSWFTYCVNVCCKQWFHLYIHIQYIIFHFLFH